VHTDAKAAESAKALNALAFTVRKDVVFGAGQYTPETSIGKALLAHELTHTLQQGAISDISSSVISRQEVLSQKSEQKSKPLQFKPTIVEVIQRLGEPLDVEPTAKPSGGETKGIQRIYGVDQYISMWEVEQGRKATDQERETLARGCIGITALNLSGGGNPPLDQCYSTFDKAKEEVDKENKNLEFWRSIPLIGIFYRNDRAVLFAKLFWSNQNPDLEKRKAEEPSAFLPEQKTGRVEMSDYKYLARPGYVNFDYGFWDETSQSFWHANHSEPGMVVFQSTKEKFAKGYADFDRIVYCVAIATNYDPEKAAKTHH
jgi:hypothetical protein